MTTQPNKKRNLLAGIAIGILVLIAAAYIFSRAGFDEGMVKAKLDEYIADIHARGLAKGRDIEVTYGALETSGGFTDKHVIVHDVSISVKPTDQPLKPGQTVKPQSLVITTPELMVYPTSMDLSSMRLLLTQPLNFASAEAPTQSLMKITGDKPLEFAIAQEEHNKVPYIVVDHKAPGAIDFTYLREQQVNAKEDATPTSVSPIYDTLHATFTPGSSFHADLAADGSAMGTVDVDFKQISMAPQSAPEGVITIATAQAKWSDTIAPDGVKTMSATANIGPIAGPADVLPNSPIAFELDGAYVAQPDVTTSKQTDHAPSTFTVKKFSLTMKDFSLTGDGDFKTVAGDMIPVGKGQIVIKNVPFMHAEMVKNNYMKPENTSLIEALVLQITGKPFDQLTDVTIPLVHDMGSSFVIGQSPVDQIVATVMKDMMQKHLIPAGPTQVGPNGEIRGGPSPLAPTLPPAGAPKSAPIAVPDNGVRG